MKVLRAISSLQRSPNEFIPVHKHLRPRERPRCQVTIWNMPEELMIYFLKGLHIKDILSMRAVHPYFRDLIDSNMPIWTAASFLDSWPSSANLQHFERAANVGNLESLVKLAIAYLYNEGLPGDFEGRKVTSNGTKAAEMFCKIENLTPNTDPFTWLFIRPPWSVNGACCKECVFTYMKDYLKKTEDKNIQVCVAKTLQLLEDAGSQAECEQHLQQAANQQSGIAAFMLWNQHRTMNILDKAGELESIRKLRDIAQLDHLDSKLELCRFYARGNYGGICKKKALSFVRDFVHSMQPLNTQEGFRSSQELTPSMRYILVDWLAEVAGMKEFSSHTLHIAVSVVDRFLRVHPTTRSKLQLLGVAAMVLCSRFLGKDIITIREAAWLTDNTYKYEDVVRMMGEITATLRGNIRVATSVDFVEIFNVLAQHEKRVLYLTLYICELALLQAEMGQYSPAEIAASAVLLARLLLKLENPWPVQMHEATGFTIEDISRCTFHMHEKCFLEGSVVDHRDITLQAVKQRYADDQYYRVSEIEIISYEELCSLLGVTEHIFQGSDVRVKFRNEDELIVSPSRGRRKTARARLETTQSEHDQRATPSVDPLNESVLSGYDGDREDEDESMLSELDDSFQKDHFSDEGMGSESDTYFASLSCAKSSPRVMSLNITFSPSSPSQRLSFASQDFNCDNGSTSSGVSSSPTAKGGERESLSPSNSSSQFSPFGGLRFTSMTLRSAGIASNLISSDSESAIDSEGPSCSKRKCEIRSPKHMTLRNTTKRKSRRHLGSGAKTYIFQ